uniref:Integral membrane efflux protein n=1 Tax=Pseudomonas putida TaxID=303 RepID=Q8KWW0_PSEPU|nr:integral membrane efflux protein [Pseudomonas putida]
MCHPRRNTHLFVNRPGLDSPISAPSSTWSRFATYVYLLSNSAMSVGIFLASRVGGGIFASLIGTRFYRRWQGRAPLIAFDLLRAALLGLLLITPASQQAWLLPFIAFGLGLGNSMFAIGLNSQLPRLIAPAQLLKANAWITSASSAAMVGGSLVSGLLVAAFGFETVFALNALTYVLAALLIMPLRFEKTDVSEQPERGEWFALRQESVQRLWSRPCSR